MRIEAIEAIAAGSTDSSTLIGDGLDSINEIASAAAGGATIRRP